MLAHDLCSPIAALRASAELLLDDISSDERREVAQYLTRQVEGLDRLARDMIAVMRDHPTAARAEVVDLAVAAHEVVDELRSDPRVRQQFTLSGEALARAEGGRARAILRNLLSNAVKYSPAESCVAIQVGAYRGHAFVSVRDHGRGISEDQLSRIFAPFYRSPEAASSAPGHGLGLYIARLLARACGGDIYVESERGCGSAFTVTFPLAGHTCSKGATAVTDGRAV